MRTAATYAPWYRHRWPWLLMAGPAAVVVAGVITTVIAVRTSDGVVADDYYKQGLGINRVLERDRRAQALGLQARLVFNEERDAVRVLLAGDAPGPERLRLALAHPTRKEDRMVELRRAAPGLYEGRLAPPRGARWNVTLEDPARTWRVAGRWNAAEPGLVLAAH